MAFGLPRESSIDYRGCHYRGSTGPSSDDECVSPWLFALSLLLVGFVLQFVTAVYFVYVHELAETAAAGTALAGLGAVGVTDSLVVNSADRRPRAAGTKYVVKKARRLSFSKPIPYDTDEAVGSE